MLISVEDDPEFEAMVEAIAAASLSSPAIRAELAALADEAARFLAAMQEQGHLRLVRLADGGIAAELLQRSVH
jgi:hypothetical protein